MKTPDERKPDSSVWGGLAIIGLLGLTISVPTVLGVLAGVAIDGKFHTSPAATLIGLLLGLAAGVYGVYRLISRM
jgi:ATP synthase protein I